MQTEADSVDIVASALDDFAAGKITWDEVDMRLHDKRYHPHGYKEGDTCKYRDGSNGPTPDSQEVQETYAQIGQGISFDRVQSYLKSEAGVHVIYADDQTSLERGGFNGCDALNFMDWGTPVPKAVHEKNVRMFYEVYKNLVSRFPSFSLMHPYLVSWRFKDEENTRALTTLDKQRKVRTNYLALGDNLTEGIAPFNPYHIIRHEMAHSITTTEVAEKADNLIRAIGTSQWIKMMESQVSERATINIEEGIAEIFSVYTEPGYKKGTLDERLESFAEYMLNLKEEGVAMDNRISHEREGLAPLNPVYLVVFDSFEPEPKGVIRWFDNAIRKHVTFDTYEARFRYVLNCFGVPKEWADAFCAQYPNRKWSIIEAQLVIRECRNATTPLRDAIERAQEWFK